VTAHHTWIITDDAQLAKRVHALMDERGLDVRLVALTEGSLAALAHAYVDGRWSASDVRSNAPLKAISSAHESVHPARVLLLTDHAVRLRGLLRELHLNAEVLGRPEDPSEILDRLLPPGRSSHLTEREPRDE